MQSFERVRHEVAVYENQVELLLSAHKECGETWDWNAIYAAPPPAAPELSDFYERKAEVLLAAYEPGLWDRLLGRVESKRQQLEEAVESGRRSDRAEYKKAVEDHKVAKADCDNSRRFARRILAGDPNAYVEAIRETHPFSDLNVLGSGIHFLVPNSTVIEAKLSVNSEKSIPSVTKSQLKSGKLSEKPVPKTRFHEMYRSYVCGCVLRVARELFALLPIKLVIVTAIGEILNTQTGHLQANPILSAAIPRKSLNQINWDSVDPADCMNNFVNHMSFKQSSGFRIVEPIELTELRAE
jgi:hypothetical protein